MKKLTLLLSMLLTICLLTGCIKINFKTGDDGNGENIEDYENDLKDLEDALKDLEDMEDFDESKDLEDYENDLKDLEDALKDLEDMIESEDYENEDFTNEEDEENFVNNNASSFANEARFGDKDNPIEMDEAGKISVSYITTESDSNVAYKYLRVKEKLSNSRAAEIAEEYNKNAFVKFTLKDGVEWRALLMEMDLKDFPIKYDSGASAQLTAISLTPTGIEHNGLSYTYLPAFAQEKVDGQRVHQGDVFEYYFVYQMPKGFDDEHLLKVFNYKNDAHPYTYFLVD